MREAGLRWAESRRNPENHLAKHAQREDTSRISCRGRWKLLTLCAGESQRLPSLQQNQTGRMKVRNDSSPSVVVMDSTQIISRDDRAELSLSRGRLMAAPAAKCRRAVAA